MSADKADFNHLSWRYPNRSW